MINCGFLYVEGIQDAFSLLFFVFSITSVEFGFLEEEHIEFRKNEGGMPA